MQNWFLELLRHGRGHRFKSCRTHHFSSIAFSCVTIVSQQRKERHDFDQEMQQQMAGSSTAPRSQRGLENISAQAGGVVVGTGAGGQL